METEMQENQLNEPSNAPAAALADLDLTAEQAQQTKGGPLNYAKIEFVYKPQKPE